MKKWKEKEENRAGKHILSITEKYLLKKLVVIDDVSLEENIFVLRDD